MNHFTMFHMAINITYSINVLFFFGFVRREKPPSKCEHFTPKMSYFFPNDSNKLPSFRETQISVPSFIAIKCGIIMVYHSMASIAYTFAHTIFYPCSVHSQSSELAVENRFAERVE